MTVMFMTEAGRNTGSGQIDSLAMEYQRKFGSPPSPQQVQQMEKAYSYSDYALPQPPKELYEHLPPGSEERSKVLSDFRNKEADKRREMDSGITVDNFATHQDPRGSSGASPNLPPGGRSIQDALRRMQSGGFDPQNQFMLGTLGGSGYGPNSLGTAGPGGSVSQHNQRVQNMRQDMPPLAYQDQMMRQPQPDYMRNVQTQPMEYARMQPMEQYQRMQSGRRDPQNMRQELQPTRMQPMEQLRGGIFGGRGESRGQNMSQHMRIDPRRDQIRPQRSGPLNPKQMAAMGAVGVMGGDDIRVGNHGPNSIQRRHGGFAPNIPNVPDGSSFPGGPPQITSPGGREVESLPGIEPPRQEIGDILPGKPPRQSPWQPPGRRRMPQPNQGYGDRFGGLQFSGPFAQPMMPRNYGMGGGYGQRPMPQPQYPRFPMHGGGMGGGYGGGMGGGMGGGYGMPQRPPMYGGGMGGGFGGGFGGGMGGGMGGGYGMPQRPPMYGGGFGGGFGGMGGGMGGGYGQMPQRPPMYGGGMGGGFGGGRGGGYGQMPQPPMYGGGRGGFGGGFGMPQRPPMYGGGMGGGGMGGGGRGGYGGGMGGMGGGMDYRY